MLIPPKVLKGISGAASDDVTRHQLNGVLLERGTGIDGISAVRATATDGKVLATATWDEPDCFEYPSPKGSPAPDRVASFTAIIPTRACREMAKMPPRNGARPILGHVLLEEDPEGETNAAFVTDLDNHRRLDVRPIEGTFPDYRSILERVEAVGGEPFRFDLRRLEQAVKVLKETLGVKKSDEDLCSVDIKFGDGNSPVAFEMKRDGTSAMVLVMPLRNEGENHHD
jgi:DNA polymerase III sliding clamp (beta) subunit (PCNA family)